MDDHQKCTDLGVDTTVIQPPRLTVFTHRTHGGGVGFTNLFTDKTINPDMTATINI